MTITPNLQITIIPNLQIGNTPTFKLRTPKQKTGLVFWQASKTLCLGLVCFYHSNARTICDFVKTQKMKRFIILFII